MPLRLFLSYKNLQSCRGFQMSLVLSLTLAEQQFFYPLWKSILQFYYHKEIMIPFNAIKVSVHCRFFSLLFNQITKENAKC